jgi:D-tyrosyl-tRNA(Tyr) deacylase
MKVLIQRVSKASVSVEGECISEISQGLLLLVGIGSEDTCAALKPMARKIANLRIFPDEKGRFHHSLLEVEGEALAVSQFTLYADTSGGRRPEFFSAMKPPEAEQLYDQFLTELRAVGIKSVKNGRFGAMMDVSLVNDGPVTIMLES